MSRAAQHSQRVTELEGLLDVVKTRVQDLEDRYLGKAVQQHSHTQQLQQEKQEAQVLYIKRLHNKPLQASIINDPIIYKFDYYVCVLL